MKNCGELGISNAIGESALFCRYICEACGHDSQWRKVDTLRLFFELKEKLVPALSRQHFDEEADEIAAYQAAAKEALEMSFARILRQTERGQYQVLLLREKGCPACGAKQGWMLKAAKRPAEFSKPRLLANPVVDGVRMLSDFVDPAEQESLSAPCAVEIMRLSSFLDSMESVSLLLNGRPVGRLRIGTAMTAQTALRHNILVLHSAVGGPALAALRFEAPPGGKLCYRFAGTKFK